MTRQEQDDLWRRDGYEHGWVFVPAAWPLRLPVIRWFRFARAKWRVDSHATSWASVGIGVGGPNPRDKWLLYAIYRGWA